MLLSAVSVLVVAQSSPEIPKGLMNNPVYIDIQLKYLLFLSNFNDTWIFMMDFSKNGQI